MSRKEIVTCDVCGSPKKVANRKMQIKRTYSFLSVLSFCLHLIISSIDICKSCHDKVLSKQQELDNE